MKNRPCLLHGWVILASILLACVMFGCTEQVDTPQKPQEQTTSISGKETESQHKKLINSITRPCTNSYLDEDIDRAIRYPSEYPFKEKYYLNCGSFRGYATLTVPTTTVAINENFEVNFCFFNQTGGDEFYNPYFNRLLDLPVVLALYDEHKQYLGDVLVFVYGSRCMTGSLAWLYIAGNSYVGTIMNVNTSKVELFKMSPKKLTPGTYYLQAIYLKSFISQNYFKKENSGLDEKQARKKFYDNYDTRELFRSNVVKMTFTERKKEKAK